MKTEFYNCPEPQEFNSALMQQQPAFLSYQPNFAEIQKIAEEYKDYKNLVIIGHGGSITSAFGMINALQEQSTKKLFIVNTVDPDYITELKKSLTVADTLVLAISKSGETVTQIEALLHFTEFPLLVITGAAGPLADMAQKLSARTIIHPPIGGRYTAFTEVALIPAALCGLDVKAIFQAGQKVLSKFNENNEAYKAASVFQQLEEKGFVDVFMPIYDSHLFPMTNLIVQLCHESFGKDGEGQTYFAHHAPESQHHSNQRFFGGRKNIAGWFMSTDKPLTDITTEVPDNLKSITLKDHTLEILNEIPLSVALNSELQGNIENAKVNNIPIAVQTLSQRTPAEVGELMAFWQLYAVYSSLLRNVDPFDQPQVEGSKKISFDKRLQYKGLL
ncbi:MAG TPA: hypothetical protein VHQ20_01995 [Patescibacteria group bacterium]|nr:hypothetical protein [Patescibacteria group bacterium]